MNDHSTNNNLPLQLTSFIGREREIAEIKVLLSSSRLLTLTGAGGCGKTRLAIHVAEDLLDAFSDGAWFVDLAPLSDPALVPQIVASIFDLHESSAISSTELIKNYFKAKNLLLILDNCEHLIQACAQLSDDLLRHCPDFKIFATSREALNISGEFSFRVPSLSLPDPKVFASIETLSQCESIRLFIARAKAASSDFHLTDRNARIISQICERIDGIPLAIELAAARVKSLSVEQIAARLDDVFRLLTGGSRTALERSRTLRATIDWSYSLLTESERALLNRLSVFAGGWTVQAAEWIGEGDGIESQSVMDLLARLIDKSLVLAYEQDDLTRYRMLETIRQYSREKLDASGEAKRVHDRHLEFFTRFMEETDPKLHGPDQVTQFDRVELELDNFRAALAWAMAGGDVDAGLRLAGAWHWFCGTRGYLIEGRSWCERLLARGVNASNPARAIAWRGDGILTFMLGDNPASAIAFENSLALYRDLGDKGNIAFLSYFLALPANSQGDWPKAKQLLDQSLAYFREIGGKWGEALVLNRLGDHAESEGDYSLANEMYAASLALSRQAGDWRAIARATGFQGRTAMLQGDLDNSAALLKEATTAFLRIRDKGSLTIFLEQGWAPLAALKGDIERSTRLYGAADAIRETMGTLIASINRPKWAATLASLRTQLDEASFNNAWKEGRAMSLEQAVEYAVQAEPNLEIAAKTSPLARPAGLTEREVEVLRWLARGFSNQEIAAKLVLSKRTIHAHLRSIYSKLDVTTRTAAVRAASENKLV